jgi:hypothetical protein
MFQPAIHEGADVRPEAAPGDINGRYALHFFTHGHTAATQDTLVVVPYDGGTGFIFGYRFPGGREADLPHIQTFSHGL